MTESPAAEATGRKEPMSHPIQDFETIDGVLRFKQNKIVHAYLDFAKERGMDLTTVARMEFSDDDRRQFSQLIGYSVDGYGDLPWVKREHLEAAYAMATEAADPRDAKIEALDAELEATREAMRKIRALAEEHDGSYI